MQYLFNIIIMVVKSRPKKLDYHLLGSKCSLYPEILLNFIFCFRPTVLCTFEYKCNSLCIYCLEPLRSKLFATNENLLKINPNGAVWVSEAAAACNFCFAEARLWT